jgi:hypothetical protein
MCPRDLHSPKPHADKATNADELGDSQQPEGNWAAVNDHTALPANDCAGLARTSLHMTANKRASANASNSYHVEIDGAKPEAKCIGHALQCPADVLGTWGSARLAVIIAGQHKRCLRGKQHSPGIRLNLGEVHLLDADKDQVNRTSIGNDGVRWCSKTSRLLSVAKHDVPVAVVMPHGKVGLLSRMVSAMQARHNSVHHGRVTMPRHG